jgi:hypothetical protein
MTLWVGLAESPASAERLREVLQLRRELHFNPERHLPRLLATDLAATLEAKRAAIVGPTATRRQRVERFRAIRELNDHLAAPLGPLREALETERARLADGLARNAIARGRDYAFVVHSRDRLRAAFGAAIPGAIPS